uniref:Asparagine synthetase [glutamine-hydrolyzing] n=1 Tax=Panagrellus redivivus TaxID=6233 RepID=A0A7E4W1J5_PANRE
MCGIAAICHDPGCAKYSLEKASALSLLQTHRGPDSRGSYQSPVTGDILCHERLAIMDLSAHQPLQGVRPEQQVVHNGEIYNHQILRETELKGYELKTTCDSEVIIFLYDKYRNGKDVCSRLDGVFAFALVYGDEFLVARDPIGVKPLYYGLDNEGRHFFSSEMKVLEQECGEHEIKAFPPGFFWTQKGGFERYYEPEWFNYKTATHTKELEEIHDALIEATEKRLMSDVPLGVLLSGGLDSSLVSSIAVRKMHQIGCQLHSFSIGLDEHAPDLIAARQVADFLGTIHHEVHFTVEDGIANLKNLIWHLETYDVTSIRASTPMFFLSKRISEMGIKVVLSGEGADEIFGGYLYFHNAPSDEEFQKETIRRVQLLSTADCLRADKSCMANALEARVPFLDKHFLDTVMSIHPKFKRPTPKNGSRPIEKYILRQAFDHDEKPYLPREILWRQKEQFSDGVGYNWIDQLMNHCAAQVTDSEYARAAELFPHNTPHNKEAFYMRKIFHEHFPSESAAQTVLKWTPKWQDNADPSGRASQVHLKTMEKPKHADEHLCAVDQQLIADKHLPEIA